MLLHRITRLPIVTGHAGAFNLPFSGFMEADILRMGRWIHRTPETVARKGFLLSHSSTVSGTALKMNFYNRKTFRYGW
jgi:hypothetical protein